MKEEEKKRALDAALAQIEKSYGKGSIMKRGKGKMPSNCVYSRD